MSRNGTALPLFTEEDQQIIDRIFDRLESGRSQPEDTPKVDMIGRMKCTVLEPIPIEYLTNGLLDPALLM